MQRIPVVLVSIAGLTLTVAAQSQNSQVAETSPAASSAGSTGAESAQLQEVVVTAEKREQRLQDVPIAITAIGAQQIANSGAVSVSALATSVPGLQYNAVAGNSQPYLRGVGSDITFPNADPSVATYIDGVFVAAGQGIDATLLSVDRVEVLAGPQGTLYGRNAVGGAINVITRTPTSQDDGSLTVGFGNYAQKTVDGYLEGGLTDNLAVGLYGSGSVRNSYLNFDYGSDSSPSGIGRNKLSSPDHESQWGLRGKLVFTAGDFKLTGSVEHDYVDGREASAVRQIQPNAVGYAFGAPSVITPYTVAVNDADYNKTRVNAVTLREEYELGWAKILGISGFRDLRNFGQIDFDGTLAPVIVETVSPYTSRQYSQELQLISAPSSKLKWIAGLYGFQERGGIEPTEVIAPVIFPMAGIPPIISTYADVLTRSLAVFAQATYPLTDAMNLTVGGRYSKDWKRFESHQDLGELDGTVDVAVPFPDATASWGKFTPKVTLDYKIEDTLLYATFSQGFKSGAFNLTAPATPGPVNPETLNAYEIGSKSDFFDRRVRLDLSAFLYNFKNIQVEVIDTQAGSSTILANAASARIYGAEAALTVAVTQDLTFHTGISALHSRYSSFPDFAGFAPAAVGNDTELLNVTGNTIQRAPKFTSTLGLTYERYLPNGGKVSTTANWYHNAGFFWEPSDTLRQKAYDLVDASVSYLFPGEHFTISAYGRNLTNQYYNNYQNISQFGTVVIDAPPRTYGMSAGFKF
jgi:iron complex outermembrane receptor protein